MQELGHWKGPSSTKSLDVTLTGHREGEEMNTAWEGGTEGGAWAGVRDRGRAESSEGCAWAGGGRRGRSGEVVAQSPGAVRCVLTLGRALREGQLGHCSRKVGLFHRSIEQNKKPRYKPPQM